jgi:hypothetical protein
MEFHRDGKKPRKNQVFVFGSNKAGRHGAGAALAARKHYGAEYYNGFGMQGKSYAIPTKDFSIQTMELEEIKYYVTIFLRFAISNPEMEFLVTRIGCGLAGYEDKDIAPMFKKAPSNCSFAEQWRPFLEEKTK